MDGSQLNIFQISILNMDKLTLSVMYNCYKYLMIGTYGNFIEYLELFDKMHDMQT